MGSMRRDDLLSLHDASKALDVHPQWVTRKLKKIGIHPVNRTSSHGKKSNELLFRREEIEAVVRSDMGPASIEQIRHSALKAEAHASLLEQRVDLLEYMLGLRTERLPLVKEEVIGRFHKAQKLVDAPRPRVTVNNIADWARFFLAVTEEYFGFMETFFKEEDPWMVFIDLGYRLARSFTSTNLADVEVHTAYSCLEVGRKNLRTVCYARSARKYGIPGAIERVPLAQEGDVDEAVLAIIMTKASPSFQCTASKYQKQSK